MRLFGIPAYALAILATLLVSQACWIFRDARRRGYNPWLWGAFGLLNVPSSLVVYLLVVREREARGRA